MDLERLRIAGVGYAVLDRTGNIVEGSIKDAETLAEIFNSIAYLLELGGDELKEVAIHGSRLWILKRIDDQKILAIATTESKIKEIEKLLGE